MKTLTLIIVTCSNIFALIPIQSLIHHGYYGGAILTGLTALASVFMHATETKHQLPGLFWAEHSNLFLNIDRFFAKVLIMYGLWLFYDHPNLLPVITSIVGLIMLGVGELTYHLPLYTFLHSSWHFLAFYSLYLVI